jgi:hypothetical protein
VRYAVHLLAHTPHSLKVFPQRLTSFVADALDTPIRTLFDGGKGPHGPLCVTARAAAHRA